MCERRMLVYARQFKQCLSLTADDLNVSMNASTADVDYRSLTASTMGVGPAEVTSAMDF